MLSNVAVRLSLVSPLRVHVTMNWQSHLVVGQPFCADVQVIVSPGSIFLHFTVWPPPSIHSIVTSSASLSLPLVYDTVLAFVSQVTPSAAPEQQIPI